MSGKKGRAALAILCAAVLVFGFFWIPLSARAEQGMVRVLLTKLNLTDRLTAALDGCYSLGDLSFQRGAKLLISCASGKIIVYYEGMALSADREIVLVRHQTEEGKENGLRLNGDYALYCGDLHITTDGHTLTPVLHIPVEEYLLGVVPYEMSDSFPLEALKAQAVAARTYALRKAGSPGDYDLVDNTNDQVFRGYSAANKQAVLAVAQTEGVCGYFNGALANCYYTASNGGQVELPQYVWGKSDGDYITRHEDPYDVENPESIVKKAFLAKHPKDGLVYSQAFTDALKMLMAEPLLSMGYTGNAEDIRIDSLEGAEVHAPKYGADSLVMTMLRLTVRAQARRAVTQAAKDDEDVSMFQIAPELQTAVPSSASPEPTATPAPQPAAFVPVPEPIVVEMTLFPMAKSMLGLSINSSMNEIITVEETADVFVIAARRYGHGVGMSQRGAQWQAGKYEWDYEKILRFYYPGMELRKIDTSVKLPPAIAAEYLTTPGPAATPTPRPTLIPLLEQPGEEGYVLTVNQIGVNSYLNLRSMPSTDSDVLRQLYYGQQLIALENQPEGWYKVRIGDLEGYVMEQFVERIK